MDARFVGIGIAIVGALFLVLMAWILDRHSLGLAWDAYLFSRGFFAGALLLLTLYGVLLSITARSGISVLLGLSAVAAIFVANAKKVEYLHTTLVPADYYFVKDIDLSTLGLFRHYVDGPVVAAAGLTLAVAIGLLLRYEPSVFRRRVVGRAVLLCVSAACGFLLVSGGKFSERIYDTQALRISYSPLESELHAGLISSLVCASNANRRALDVVTDPAAVSQVIATERSRFPGAAARPPTPDGQRPDIILVQSESFFDPAIMEGVSSGDLLPNLHRAQAENRASTMTVPTFGGGTLRTEFEVLTGIPLEAYPDLQFPYLQISKSRISSIATVLADAGYSTVAIHPNSGAFWNRRVALRSLGFQQFITINDFPATAYRDGFYLSDHSMTTQVIDSLEQAKEPAFIFAISIEAHGPYRHGVVKNEAERDALPAPVSWSPKAVGEFRTYSYHIRHADAELGRLWDYLKHRNRPFILVFYGDHLPGFEFAYDSAKFRNGMPPYQQSVPWLLLSNARTNAEDAPEHIFSWMLADEILRQAAVDEPHYFRFAGNVGRMLQEGAAPDQTHAGLQSAARMRLSGTFDGFYRSHARAD